MKYYINLTVSLFAVWVATFLLEQLTDFTLFESFVLFVLTILLSTDIGQYFKEVK